MLAIDHGYFQGPTTGLERVDLGIVPIAPYADALMLTRGILRSTIPATHRGGIVMRASGGPSILKELSDERMAVDVEDAARMNVHALAVQVFVGGEHETQSVENMTKLVDAGYRYGIPVLGVTAVGKELTRDARYLGLATRICAELGAQIVKTYYAPRASRRSRRVPGAGRDGRRQEAARARRARDGLPRDPGGCRRRRHGPQHLPEPCPGGDDPGRREGRPRGRPPRDAYELFEELAREAAVA